MKAVEGDDYNKGDCDFSTTELIGPPRIAVLKKQWQKHLIEDVSDRIFALLGKSVHTILEHSAESKHYLIERRFIAEHDGYRIGGQIDLFDTKTSILQDWKVTTYHGLSEAQRQYPWSTLRTAPTGKGWIEQANVNAYLMFRNGYNVKGMEYVAIYRDWSKMQVARGVHGYPPRQVEVLRIPRWTHGETEAYLSDRIKAHVDARKNLPLCTPDERWEKPAMFAVKKHGAKRATRLLETEFEAQELAAKISTVKARYGVEPRPGEPIRCLYYCSVSGYCSYGREVLQEKQAAIEASHQSEGPEPDELKPEDWAVTADQGPEVD